MAKQKGNPPAEKQEREDKHPSAELLTDLEGLRKEKNKKKRVLKAWQTVLRVLSNNDYPVVLDYALEHGLVQACDAGGQQTQNIIWTNPIDGSEMVWIPPGPFVVGTQKKRAECNGFSLARHPVTNGQFSQFLHETGYTPPDEHPDRELFLSHWAAEGGSAPGAKILAHPVVCVSYLDALQYCSWAGLSLPTEWLWEKAARGPEGRRFPWGDDFPRRTSEPFAQVDAAGTCPVGSFPRMRTPYGCEDMVGNVSEWCQMTEGDDFGFMPEPVAEIPAVPEGDPVYTAVRGSCFLRTDRALMASSHQRRLSITRRNQWVGFRPAFLLAFQPGQ
jgi:serine/threonine-protein kinase